MSALTENQIEIERETKKRRTFAIISHPDAGKTTLTEKLLLYSDMIHTAGMVKGRKGRKAATSDWMGMEQERGISITASAMQFPYKNVTINILDTPGHQDFSEDTYRTLTAADSAIMVIDCMKGVEKQTLKLFEVCSLRKTPVLTFVNKLDMPGKDPLDLVSEVEGVLGIEAYCMNWPIGTGKQFTGVFDRIANQALIFKKASIGGSQKAEIIRLSLDSPELQEYVPQATLDELKDQLELLEIAGNTFDRERFLKAEVTPVFFGSALSNFGIEPFFDSFIELAPSPSARIADRPNGEEAIVDPVRQPFSAYVFKLQANMDKKHRDSMAFLRVCSGKFERELVVKHHRLKREIRLSRSLSMVAGDRATVDIGYPGDIIGVINPGVFMIGDTVSINGDFQFKPLPQFQPEIFARIYPKDIGKRKSFDKGVNQLADEGAIQLLITDEESPPIFAAVGKLQFEVMQYRLQDEYGVETVYNPLSFESSGWLVGDLASFQKPTNALITFDRKNRPLVLFADQWSKQYACKQNPNHQIVDIL